MKEFWLETYENLICEYMDLNPNATEAEAEKFADDNIERTYANLIGNMIDQARDRAKYD